MDVSCLAGIRTMITWRGKSSIDVYAAFACDSGPGYVKVGYSRNPGMRVQAIQTGCPLPVVGMVAFPCSDEISARGAERAVHEFLSDVRASGEWFRCADVPEFLELFRLAASGHGCGDLYRPDKKVESRISRQAKKAYLERCRMLATHTIGVELRNPYR